MKNNYSYEEAKQIESKCLVCNEMTLHSIIPGEEDGSKALIQCMICEETLSYKPKTKLHNKVVSGKKATTGIKSKYMGKDGFLDFTNLVSKHNVAAATQYETTKSFTINEVINHHLFGIGFIIGTIFPNKIEVLFSAGYKILICAPRNEESISVNTLISKTPKGTSYKNKNSPARKSWSKTSYENMEPNDWTDFETMD